MVLTEATIIDFEIISEFIRPLSCWTIRRSVGIVSVAITITVMMAAVAAAAVMVMAAAVISVVLSWQALVVESVVDNSCECFCRYTLTDL